MNKALRMARSRSIEAKLTLKINRAKDGARIDRRETSFSGSHRQRTDPPCQDNSGNDSHTCTQ